MPEVPKDPAYVINLHARRDDVDVDDGAAAIPAIDYDADVERIAAALARESPLEHVETKAELARVIAGMMVRHNMLNSLALKRELAAEVERTLPAIASNIKRLMADLQLSGKGAKKKAKGFV